jgi:hypothetical protein
MELFGLHVPGTRDKDAEIRALKRQLEDKDGELEVSESLRRKYFEEKIDAAVAFRQKEEAMVGQLRKYEEHSGQLKEKNRELTRDVEVHRTAFNALAVMQGLNPDLSQERMLGLARQATEIERAANASCSLSYELFAVQVCDAADRILPKLNPQEAKFFTACLGDNDTPVHERGQDWQSEHEIRQELYREMYGDPDAYDDFEEEQEQEQDRGVDARDEEPEQEQQQGMDLSIGL